MKNSVRYGSMLRLFNQTGPKSSEQRLLKANTRLQDDLQESPNLQLGQTTDPPRRKALTSCLCDLVCFQYCNSVFKSAAALKLSAQCVR